MLQVRTAQEFHVNQTKNMTIAGWTLSGLIGAFMTFSAAMKFVVPPDMEEQFVGKFGYTKSLAMPIGITELVCVGLFLFPRTAVLGAILLTGYLGGAVATHVRVGDAFIAPAIVGVVAWLALYLRDARIRALAPIVKRAV